MTYAELTSKMSSAEFELWMALAQVRSTECPSCGHEARELMEWDIVEVKCPVCKHTYGRVKRLEN